MSPDPFPEFPDALRLFARNGKINANLPFARLLRFSDYLFERNGQVTVNLNFEHDAAGRRHLSGSLASKVVLQCQRCLQPLQQDLNSSLDILVLDTEAELEELEALHEVSNSADAVIGTDEELDILGIIEDELILSLPLAVVHEDEHCNTQLDALKQQATEQLSSKQNPFTVLSALKKDS